MLAVPPAEVCCTCLFQAHIEHVPLLLGQSNFLVTANKKHLFYHVFFSYPFVVALPGDIHVIRISKRWCHGPGKALQKRLDFMSTALARLDTSAVNVLARSNPRGRGKMSMDLSAWCWTKHVAEYIIRIYVCMQYTIMHWNKKPEIKCYQSRSCALVV